MDALDRMMLRRWGSVAAVALAMVAGPADARHFENSYISFEVPDEWTCGREDDDWVCQPPKDSCGKVDMIAIVVAKFVGPGDSPQLYIAHLQEVGRRAGVSTLVAPKDTLINSSLWLDATLMNSDVPNYQTRYLMRTEGNVAVGVTFSANRTSADRARPISDLIARSVQVNSFAVVPELRGTK